MCDFDPELQEDLYAFFMKPYYHCEYFEPTYWKLRDQVKEIEKVTPDASLDQPVCANLETG